MRTRVGNVLGRTAAGLTGLTCVVGCGVGDGPWIDSVEPGTAARGAAVTVRGERFCGADRATGAGDCEPLPPGSVVFGIEPPIARALVLSWGEREIAVQVPASAPLGQVDVVVTVDGRSSNGITVEVTPEVTR